MLPDDKKGATLDCILGAACHVGAMTAVAGSGLLVASYERFGFIAPIVGLLGMFPAPFLVSLGCYFFTPPSERRHYQETHSWMPSWLTNYLNKKTT